MPTAALQQYLHDHIPLSKSMGVEVIEATAEKVRLSAPLAPNINHRETVFGGSASAVAILAAWSLLHLRLQEEALSGRVVIQRNTMLYQRPIMDAFTATSVLSDAAAWSRFMHTLKRKHRARIGLGSVLHCNGENVGQFEGEFVTMAQSL